jgi:hypothetical protein
MKLQDLSDKDKAWLMSLTLPWGKLRGKVKIDMGSGNIFWSDDSARAWFEEELAKRHGEPPRPIPQPPQPQGPEVELRERLAEIDASPVLKPAEREAIRTRVIQEYYGRV